MKIEVYLFMVCLLAAAYGQDRCPPEPNLAYGCAYMPHCFSNADCTSGQICCRRTCGDQCMMPDSGSGGTSTNLCEGKWAFLCTLGRR